MVRPREIRGMKKKGFWGSVVAFTSTSCRTCRVAEVAQERFQHGYDYRYDDYHGYQLTDEVDQNPTSLILYVRHDIDLYGFRRRERSLVVRVFDRERTVVIFREVRVDCEILRFVHAEFDGFREGFRGRSRFVRDRQRYVVGRQIRV